MAVDQKVFESNLFMSGARAMAVHCQTCPYGLFWMDLNPLMQSITSFIPYIIEYCQHSMFYQNKFQFLFPGLCSMAEEALPMDKRADDCS